MLLCLASAVEVGAGARIVRAGGLAAVVPAQWHGRVRIEPGALAVLEASNRPFPRGDALAPRRLGNLDRGAVVVRIAEVGNRPNTAGFIPLVRPLRIATADVRVRPTPLLGGAPSASRRFASGGRSFSLVAAFGARPPRPATLSRVNTMLKTLEIAPGRRVDVRTKTRLRRPLRLGGGGGACPRSGPARSAARIAWPVGKAPVFVALGAPDGVAPLEDDRRVAGGYAHKTLWAVAPRYRSPLLIRGGRRGGDDRLRFGLGRGELDLWLPAEPRRGWRYIPSTTVIPGPGCYAFQVDGTSFARTIVFEARR